jgi:CelD/BcsL family acetyltransferase involved in cellulose biosynthesis
VFATPEWLLTWWRHLAAGELHLWRWGDAQAPRAILPLHLHDGTLRFLGHPAADQLGPVCTPEDREPAARALRSLLEGGWVAWRVFAADDLPADVPWADLLGASVSARQPSPFIQLLGGTWDDFLATRSRNFRAQVRGRERRLQRAGRMRYRVTSRPDELDRDFDVFLSLHYARWGEPTYSFEGRIGFHREFMREALSRGWLRLRFLELDGRPLAALYNLRFGEAESFYQSGRDPAHHADSAGFVLQAHAVREALEDGLAQYRLLRGGEAYKARFADRDIGLVSVRRDA